MEGQPRALYRFAIIFVTSMYPVIARSETTKQSRWPPERDCLAALAMTTQGNTAFFAYIPTVSSVHNGKPLLEFTNAYRSACTQAGLEDFTYHDLRHCAVNNLRLAGNDYYRIIPFPGKRPRQFSNATTLVTEEELQDMKWEAKKGTMDTKAEGK